MNLHQSWFDVDGDNTFALNWDLNKNSLVWEIGGFEGRWAQQIWDKFHCYITIFEPQLWAVERMQKRFEGIGKIEIKPYGLMAMAGDMEWETFPIGGYETDGAGIYSDRLPVKTVQFRNIFSEIISAGHLIDLALMNIEGSEYDVLPELISSSAINRFRYFWCQFHPGLVGIAQDERDHKAEEIFDGMAKTHDMIWNFYPTATAWKRR